MEDCTSENCLIEKKEDTCRNECMTSSVENNNNNTNINNNNNNISVDNDNKSDSSKNFNGELEKGSSSTEIDGKNVEDDTESKVPIGPIYLPPHLMGRDLNNPAEDVIGTGRRVQKPRLGVKVPYRNLTSQIVSQDEIAQELLERSLRKYSYHDVPEGGDMFFAMKLTHRLANKISSNCVDSNKETDSSNESIKNENDNESLNTTVEITTELEGIKSILEEDKTVAEVSTCETKPVSSTPLKNVNIITKSTNSCLNEKSSALKKPNVILLCSTKEIPNADEGNKNGLTNTLQNISIKRDKTELKVGTSCKKDKIIIIEKKTPVGSITLNESMSAKVSNMNQLNSTVNCLDSKCNKNEMDNETLIAILEGTADILPPVVEKPLKRKKFFKETLDPKLEKELALKQLEDFEKNAKRKKNSISNEFVKRLKRDNSNDTLNNSERLGVSGTSNKIDNIPHNSKKLELSNTKVVTNDNINSVNIKIKKSKNILPKKVPKRRPVQYKYDSIPKRLPKKYQRIIKKQIRNSKLKSKNAVNNSPEVQKKLPEVPEVQIAIDQYIKTYANKRKHKSIVVSTISNNVSPASDTILNNKPSQVLSEATCVAQPSDIAENNTINDKNTVDSAIEMNHENELQNNHSTASNEVKANDKGTIMPDQKNANTVSKKNTKMMREINRLLGDEGAINMIYSVEQKRVSDDENQHSILPSLRRKKKDLVLKTKLVKNAVLRFSMSNQAASSRVGRGKNHDISKVNKKIDSPPKSLNKSSSSNKLDIVLHPRKVAADASKIIRRHSSSSSSGDEERLNILNASVATPEISQQSNQCESIPNADQSNDDVANLESNRVVASTSGGSLNTEPFKVNRKSNKTVLARTVVHRIVHKKKSKIQLKNLRKNYSIANKKIAGKPIKAGTALLGSSDQIEDIIIHRHDISLVKIIVTSKSAKMKNALNIQVLKALTSALTDLENDSSCHAVLVTSTGGCFCQGIDLSTLVCGAADERRKIAEEFVSVLDNFIKCLANFPKPIIAGVHGAATGLGVTMLPFFDVILASDKATFYTPYAKFGQIPEGAAVLTLPSLLGTAVTNEMLFGCRMLTASEALQFGLITRILWPDKFSEELISLSKGIAKHSLQSLQATKLLLRQDMRSKLDAALEAEGKYLIEHWCSNECQDHFKRYLMEEAI